MKDMHQKDEEKEGISPITAAVTGAVIGAGAAIAGTVALKDENNRKKVKSVLFGMKDQAVQFVGEKMDTNPKVLKAHVKSEARKVSRRVAKSV